MTPRASFRTPPRLARLAAATLICAGAAIAPAWGQPADPVKAGAAEELRSKRYEDCITLAQTDAFAAREEAARWEAVGGGARARHCAAIALIAQHAEREAAQILTEIGSAPESRLNAEDRISILSLAGELWLQLGRHELAKRSYGQALKLSPDHRLARIGAAHAAAGLGDAAGAEKILTDYLNKRPDDAEALTFRASARRLMGQKEPALEDARAATKLQPTSAPAWFERGAAERALGQNAEARESWIRAAMLDLTGQVGDDARHALAILDAGG